MRTLEPLDGEISVAVKTAPSDFVGLATITRHLTLSGLGLTVTLYPRQDATEGFGLWLCPAGA